VVRTPSVEAPALCAVRPGTSVMGPPRLFQLAPAPPLAVKPDWMLTVIRVDVNGEASPPNHAVMVARSPSTAATRALPTAVPTTASSWSSYWIR